ncbi:MAG TPA: SAM-dependent methyltransferase [Steroidobacteraceae bacterium]|nr:SAM-dependent methyltransferase [Steroidobacteraceae bacterium]
MSPPLHDVSDTAFWIAYHRALESERPDALFHDPFAARLAGERGRRISEAMPTSRIVGWMVALRTRIIDDYITLAVRAGIDTVLCLGAGLDARPYRMALPPGLRWIEADYPHVIEYKEAVLRHETPRCRLERVKIDLAVEADRQALLERIDASSEAILILTEGVIPYLDNDEAASLAGALRSMRRARFWIVDYLSPQAVEFRRRRRVSRAMQNAPFKFAPGDWFAFFREHGWQVKEIRYYPEEGVRYSRPMPLAAMARLLLAVSRLWMTERRRGEFRRFGGYALLEPLE